MAGNHHRNNDRNRGDRDRNRGRGSGRSDQRPPKRGTLVTGDATDSDLPKWVREEINRSTPKDRREPTIRLLGEAAHHYGAGKYQQALPKLIEAKKLSSATATIRELLGLSHYHLGQWDKALQEFRTFRRLSGETQNMPAEMDCLRALDRPADVEKTWKLFNELGGAAPDKSEARVVYASFLLDVGRARDAWSVIAPKRIGTDAPDYALREWYVAARAANELGDSGAATKLANAIEKRDPQFPGLGELRDAIDA